MKTFRKVFVIIFIISVVGIAVFIRNIFDPQSTSRIRSTKASLVWHKDWNFDPKVGGVLNLSSEIHKIAEPIIVNEKLFVIGTDRRLHVLSPETGKELWSFSYEGGGVFQFKIKDPYVIIICAKFGQLSRPSLFTLTALDINTGQVLWKKDTEKEIIIHSLTPDKNGFYYAFGDNLPPETKSTTDLHTSLVYAKYNDGTNLWEKPLESNGKAIDYIQISIFGDTISVLEDIWFAHARIETFEKNSGARKWQYSLKELDNFFNPVHSYDNSTLFIQDGDEFTLLNQKTGKIEMNYPFKELTDQKLQGNYGMVHQGTYYVLSIPKTESATTAKFTAFDVRNRKTLWSSDIGYKFYMKGTGRPRQPSYQNGAIYLGGYDGNIYSLDSATGKVNFRIDDMDADDEHYAPLIYKDLLIVKQAPTPDKEILFTTISDIGAFRLKRWWLW